MTTILVLTLLGIILVVSEMFLPGLILGLLGVVMLGSAIVVGYTQYGPIEGTMILVGIAAIAMILFVLWMKYFQRTSIGRGMTLGTNLPRGGDLPCASDLVGQTGEAVTDLRPSGRAMIDGKRLDVLADGGFVERGSQIIVISAQGNRVFVRKNA